jgi:hypothetical protein
VFNTGSYFDECKTWNATLPANKTWENFKTHFLDAQDQLRQQQATGQQGGFHGANANSAEQHSGVTNEIYQETAEALANLATASSTDRQALSNLTNTVAALTQQLSAKDSQIKTLQEQLRKKRVSFDAIVTDNGTYCWSHGYKVGKQHTSESCHFPKPGHIKTATRKDTKNGCQHGKP